MHVKQKTFCPIKPARFFHPVVLSLVLAMTQSGCSSLTPRIQQPDPDRYSTAQASVKLAEAASTVSHSMESLAQVQQALHPGNDLGPPPTPSSYGMGNFASIDWVGPIGPIVKKIAASSGYQLHILGKEPTIPIIVSIASNDTPIGDILRDIGFQAGSKADIVVYSSRKLIELRYTG